MVESPDVSGQSDHLGTRLASHMFLPWKGVPPYRQEDGGQERLAVKQMAARKLVAIPDFPVQSFYLAIVINSPSVNSTGPAAWRVILWPLFLMPSQFSCPGNPFGNIATISIVGNFLLSLFSACTRSRRNAFASFSLSFLR